ncbi:YbdD/YjiX family protein [Roseomonas soli]|uniref:YbdD/YjiX family protein n=1 Tax=Neoroseomonas soli TaxID=1081025 RepID=A0A9X9WQZ8_9PROT|nr:YbdD/YjiX family protein [Neoroseomonas soli]
MSDGNASARQGRVTRLFSCICDGARLMVGVPRYEDYVAHMARMHPGEPPMTYEEFFRNRQAARYGASKMGGMRCC